MQPTRKANRNKTAVYSIALKREHASPLMAHATWLSAFFVLSFIVLQLN
jgi:hypothetical protein